MLGAAYGSSAGATNIGNRWAISPANLLSFSEFHLSICFVGVQSKLYISGHSAVETQAFYKAMGCVEAKEYNQKHVELEPYDCQLEYQI